MLDIAAVVRTVWVTPMGSKFLVRWRESDGIHSRFAPTEELKQTAVRTETKRATPTKEKNS